MRSQLRSDTVLNAFLSRCSPEKRRELEPFLSEAERRRLAQLPHPTGTIHPQNVPYETMLETVHWSWFLPTLKTYSDLEIQQMFLSCLSPQAAKNLAKTLHLLALNPPAISPLAKAYFQDLLLRSLIGQGDTLLPIDFLPQSPLLPLLHLSKSELIRIIDLLSLHDLAAELRQIVETKILKKIYILLSEEERSFLKIAMAHKEYFSLPRMGLDRWDGSEESFRVLLHRRGLARLGAALSGQNPDFLWYICHQLDIGRGNALLKLCAKEPLHGVSEPIIRQIEEILKHE